MSVQVSLPSNVQVITRTKYLGCPFCGDERGSNDGETIFCCGEVTSGIWMDCETGETIEDFQVPAGCRIEWEQQ